MAGSVNKAFLIGRVGKDPKVRQTNGGKKIASFSLATSESWRDRETGDRKERTQWHQIVVFSEPLAEIVEKYVKKGSLIGVEGQIESRKWTDNGQEKYTTEIVLRPFRGEINLFDRKEGGGGPPPPDEDDYGTTKETNSDSGGGGGFPDDEIPF